MRQSSHLPTGQRPTTAWREPLTRPGTGEAPLARRPQRRPELEADSSQRGLYIISVAARLLEMHPQTLRKYERIGLVRPSRTIGMLRLYSEENVAQLRAIKYLVEDLRLNLAGVELVMDMMRRLITLRQRLAPSGGNVIAHLHEELERILDMLRAH